ncbi:MAG: succinate dehydrogenase, cytochrome b556 subunit [Amphiplicatus sp.]
MDVVRRPRERPLSPHLQVYRPKMTMAMSIMHRITGAALYVGALLLAWWLIAASNGPAAYSTFQAFAHSFAGNVILIGYLWALIHHMIGGLRHFVWDAGKGFDLPTATAMAYANLIVPVILTALILFVIGFTSGVQ